MAIQAPTRGYLPALSRHLYHLAHSRVPAYDRSVELFVGENSMALYCLPPVDVVAGLAQMELPSSRRQRGVMSPRPTATPYRISVIPHATAMTMPATAPPEVPVSAAVAKHDDMKWRIHVAHE